MESIYFDGIEDIASEVGKIGSYRASTVEWEIDGWVVRSCENRDFVLSERDGTVVAVNVCQTFGNKPKKFQKRADALHWEVVYFWDLLRGKNER